MFRLNKLRDKTNKKKYLNIPKNRDIITIVILN